jgi:hypothetical protein
MTKTLSALSLFTEVRAASRLLSVSLVFSNRFLTLRVSSLFNEELVEQQTCGISAGTFFNFADNFCISFLKPSSNLFRYSELLPQVTEELLPNFS